jgi:hypothetical protein
MPDAKRDAEARLRDYARHIHLLDEDVEYLLALLRAAETRGREAGLNQGLREATGLNVVEIRASVQGVLDWGLKLRGPCSCTYDYTCHHCYEMQQVRGRLVRSLGSPAPAGEEE